MGLLGGDEFARADSQRLTVQVPEWQALGHICDMKQWRMELVYARRGLALRVVDDEGGVLVGPTVTVLKPPKAFRVLAERGRKLLHEAGYLT